MVRIITIRTEGDLIYASRFLARIKDRLPAMSSKAMFRWGKILERDLKRSARLAGLKNFTGALQTTGIRYEQRPRGRTGYLFMRIYGVYQDSMKPPGHYVSIHRRRTRLLAWAKVAQNPNIRRRASLVEKGKMRSFSIFVKPHPFIETGYARARPKLEPIVKKMAEQAVQTS